MNENETFWIVYLEDGPYTERKYGTINDAVSRAMAVTKETGKNTYVLKCVGRCRLSEPFPIYVSEDCVEVKK